jgi:hypothetical protein
MKVFNLCCDNDHAFEGWFASADTFDSQLAQGLIECPICGDKSVRRLPSAPRLNLSSGGSEPAVSASPQSSPPSAPSPQQLQAIWAKMARYIRENTEDVGERFAEEARRIHYDEAPERAIRGVASRDEAKELADEGIEVFSFPLPKGPGGPLQ